MSRILVVAPHADDEIIGVGGTLLKWKRKGHDIKIILFACSDIYMHHTKGVVSRETREQEFKLSANLLSSEEPKILYLKDSELDRAPIQSIIRVLDDELDTFNPDIFVYPEPSYHQDHQIVNKACTASLRPTKKDRPSKILEYEVPTSGWAGSARPFTPNYYVDISTDISKKAEIFQTIYKSQFSTTDRCKLALDGILNHARYRGHECGVEFAEAFRLLYFFEQDSE